MNALRVLVLVACCVGCGLLPLDAAEQLPPIERVSSAPNRAIHVNGEPFFPLMAWLQDAASFPTAQDCGMNTIAGYWPIVPALEFTIYRVFSFRSHFPDG